MRFDKIYQLILDRYGCGDISNRNIHYKTLPAGYLTICNTCNDLPDIIPSISMLVMCH
jgi:hypothetical protein